MIVPENASFLVMTASRGTGAAFMFKTGGSDGLIRVLEKKLTTKKRVGFLAYFLGMIIFFNDYVNSVIVGNATKDITAKHKMRSEERRVGKERRNLWCRKHGKNKGRELDTRSVVRADREYRRDE